MSSPRKRRKSTESNSYRSLKKRRASSSSIAKTASSTASGSQGRWWKLKDILDQSPTHYLIDWEDDPETGEKFTPTWERKSNVNATAINAWGEKKKDNRNSRSSKLNQIAVRKQEAASQSDTETPVKTTTLRSRQIIHSSESPAHHSQETLQESSQPRSELTDSQLTLLTPPSLKTTNLQVAISPHSSLDPNQYLLYASQSTQTQPSTQPVRSGSDIRGSPPVPITPLVFPQARNGVVPDSQNLLDSPDIFLPGSKSIIYSSVTRNSSSRHQSILRNPEFVVDKVNLSASHSAVPDLAESDNSSGLVPQRTIQTSRQLSDPSLQRSSRRGSRRRVHSPETSFLSLGPGDKATVHEADTRSKAAERSSSRRDRLRESSAESSLFEPATQGTSTSRHPSAVSSAEHSPYTQDRQPVSTYLSSNDSQSSELNFQTQVPLHLDSQFPQLVHNSTSPREEVWQGVKRTNTAAFVASKGSSASLFEGLPSVQDRTRSIRSTAEATTASQSPIRDSEQNGQGSIGADALIQRLRERNNQTGQLPHSAQLKEDIALDSVESPDLVAEELSSSIAPAAPSQLPKILDLNPPRRLPEPSEMDTSGDVQASIASALQNSPGRSSPIVVQTGPSLREKLRQMRSNSAAKFAHRRSADASPLTRDSKSPSVIPEPTPREEVGDSRLEVRTIEVPRPQRTSHSGLHTPVNPSKLHLHNEISQPPIDNALVSPELEEMEFVVPLPLPARVKDQYIQLLEYYRSAIKRFREEDLVDETLSSTMRKLLTRLNHVTTHVDLDNDTTLTQQDVSPEMQVSWAVDSSGKFQFLLHLMRFMQNQESHIVVVAEGGRLLDLLEAFLQGLGIGYNRPDNSAVSASSRVQSRLHASLIASGEVELSTLLKPASLIIAFDASYNSSDPQILGLRKHKLQDGHLAPVIRLIVYSSAEHIVICIPDSLDRHDRLRATIESISENSEDIGTILPEEFSPVAAAEEVSVFVAQGGHPYRWTLLPIRPITIYGVVEEMARRKPTPFQPRQTNNKNQAASIVSKRPLSTIEDGLMLQKRQRMTPTQDTTHISDSVGQSATQPIQGASQTVKKLQSALQTAQQDLENLRTTHAAREQELQAALTDSKKKRQELVEALGALSDRYEDKNTKYHTIRHEKEELLVAAGVADHKREILLSETAKLKEERKNVDEELRAARILLSASKIPEIAKLEQLNAEARFLSLDKETLENRVKYLTRDFEFTRQQYQTASAAAAEAANRVTALEAENQDLRKIALGEQVKLRQLNIMSTHRQHLAEIEKLTVENADMKELLRKQQRGRGVTTRTGSVAPKSPKLGGGSPGRSRAGSRAPGSRGVSPVRGFLGVRKGRGPVD